MGTNTAKTYVLLGFGGYSNMYGIINDINIFVYTHNIYFEIYIDIYDNPKPSFNIMKEIINLSLIIIYIQCHDFWITLANTVS